MSRNVFYLPDFSQSGGLELYVYVPAARTKKKKTKQYVYSYSHGVCPLTSIKIGIHNAMGFECSSYSITTPARTFRREMFAWQNTKFKSKNQRRIKKLELRSANAGRTTTKTTKISRSYDGTPSDDDTDGTLLCLYARRHRHSASESSLIKQMRARTLEFSFVSFVAFLYRKKPLLGVFLIFFPIFQGLSLVAWFYFTAMR